jgi:6-phosphogluconolactonase (cycloisomerase 2 family)
MPTNAEYRLYVGTYTDDESAAQGISLVRVDSSGGFRPTGHVAEAIDPSFLAWGPHGSVLYSVNERSHGRVTAFAVLPDGTLNEINSQPSQGEAPCHLSVHPSGRYLLTANYLSGNLAVHPVAEGGVLRQACHVTQHSGSGPNAERQRGPHAHQVLPDRSGKHVLAVDLGTDTVYVYDFDAETGHLALRYEEMLPAGSGPRHLAFHPAGRHAYLISELASTMTELTYDEDKGVLGTVRTLPTLPESFGGTNLASEVVVSPDGRFVYGSNRGHDSIAVYGAEGGLELLEIRAALVSEPRHIALSPDGSVLFVAGQHSDDVQAFSTGGGSDLTPIGDPVPTPKPVCLLPAPQS